MNPPLHLLKPHRPTLLALKVIDNSSQRLEVLSTVPVGAMIQILLMSRRVQMLIQPVHRVKPLVAQIALPVAAVPGPVRAAVGVLGGGAAVPADEFLGNQSGRILGPHELVDRVSV